MDIKTSVSQLQRNAGTSGLLEELDMGWMTDILRKKNR